MRSIATARTFSFASNGNLVFAGDDGDIWSINRDGGEQRQLTNNPFKDSCPRISPDGRYIFFASARSGSVQVWRMNSDGSNQVQFTKREGGYPLFVTPDGKWLYFQSGVQHKLWRISPDGSDEMQIAEPEVLQPAFSPDGKLAAYFSRAKASEPYKFAIMSIGNGKLLQSFSLAHDKAQPISIAWQADNQSLDYIILDTTNSIWRQSLYDVRPQHIADLGNEEINDLAVSPDGNQIGLIRGKWVHGAVLIKGLK